MRKGTREPSTAVACLNSLIGPSGLLLVFSHLFAVPILVFWMKLGKKRSN